MTGDMQRKVQQNEFNSVHRTSNRVNTPGEHLQRYYAVLTVEHNIL